MRTTHCRRSSVPPGKCGTCPTNKRSPDLPAAFESVGLGTTPESFGGCPSRARVAVDFYANGFVEEPSILSSAIDTDAANTAGEPVVVVPDHFIVGNR